jgi:hypothetical protein
LPVFAIFGALAKESFVPFSIVFTTTWWAVSRRHERWNAAETIGILCTGIAGLVTIAVLQSAVSGHIVWPWTFAASMRAQSGHLAALKANIIDRNLLYGFVWLLPVGLLRLGRFSRPWVVSCCAAAALDLALVAYYGAPPGAAARSLFSIAGPLLSLSAATLVAPPSPAAVERPKFQPTSQCA